MYEDTPIADCASAKPFKINIVGDVIVKYLWFSLTFPPRKSMMTSRVTTNWGSLILHRVNLTGKEIGRGAYGRVFEVNYEGTLCAAKEVHALLLQYAQGEDLQKIKDDFLRECQIWSTLRHPCVVQFLGSEILHAGADPGFTKGGGGGTNTL